MIRILVSPRAFAVAAVLLPYLDRRSVNVTDDQLCQATGLTTDTCYRALSELESLGALHATSLSTSPTSTDKKRRIKLAPFHWLWAAVRNLCLACGELDCAGDCWVDSDPAPTCSHDRTIPCERCASLGWDTCQAVGT